MTSRERVLAAINSVKGGGEAGGGAPGGGGRVGSGAPGGGDNQMPKPDRMPMDFGGTLMSVCLPEFLEDIRDVLGYKLPEDRDIDGSWVDEAVQRYLDVDLRLVPGSVPQAVLKGIDHDEFLRREQKRNYIKMADRSIVTHSVRTEFKLKGLSYDEINEGYREGVPELPPQSQMDWIVGTAKRYRDDGYATTFWASSGVFEIGCWERGYDQICMDMAQDKDVAHLIFERVMEARLAWLDKIIPPLADYVDIFCFGDDLALQTGPFMSPAMFREMVMPYLAPMYKRVLDLAPDSFVFHHSCGSVYKLIPMLSEMGVSVLNPTQISAVDMAPERLKGYGGVCYHGGIDLQDVLPHYAPGEVKREAERVMRILAPGYICAPCHSLPEDVPVENILAMFRADRGVI